MVRTLLHGPLDRPFELGNLHVERVDAALGGGLVVQQAGQFRLDPGLLAVQLLDFDEALPLCLRDPVLHRVKHRREHRNAPLRHAHLRVVRLGLQPGDKVQWNITVIDNSGKYGYLKESGAVGTIDFYNTEGMGAPVIGEGFEGYQIENADKMPGSRPALSRIPRRGGNVAIQKLAEISGKSIAGNPTDEKVGQALYEIGYGAEGEGDEKKPLAKYAGEGGEPNYIAITMDLLDDYYLDYLNAAYYAQDEHKDEDKTQPHYTGFANLSSADFRSIFSADTGTQVMETNPVLVDALYYGTYEKTILMSESQSGIENFNGTYHWMQDWDENTEGNDFDSVIAGQYKSSAQEQGDATVHHLQWYQWITGSYNGNNMQDTYFGLAYQFKLVRKIKITKVEKGHKDSQHTLAGVEFKLTKVDADGHNVDSQPEDLPFTGTVVADGEHKGELVLPALPSGRYKLEETKAPAGYIIAESAWYMNVDTSGNATFENTQAAPSTLVSVKTDKSNEFWVENEPGAALPNSGGPGTTWMYVMGMMLTAAAGGALVVRRRMNAAE